VPADVGGCADDISNSEISPRAADTEPAVRVSTPTIRVRAPTVGVGASTVGVGPSAIRVGAPAHRPLRNRFLLPRFLVLPLILYLPLFVNLRRVRHDDLSSMANGYDNVASARTTSFHWVTLAKLNPLYMSKTASN